MNLHKSKVNNHLNLTVTQLFGHDFNMQLAWVNTGNRGPMLASLV